jgi:hypothetical protein
MVGPGSYAGGFAIGKSITVSGAGPGLTTIRGGGPVITFGLGERQLERAGVGVACFCLAVEPAQKIRTGGVEVAIVRQGELVEKHKRRLWPFAFGDRFGRRRNLGIYGGLAGLAVAMGPIIGGAVTPRDRLALDLLDQRADRSCRPPARDPTAARKAMARRSGSTCSAPHSSPAASLLSSGPWFARRPDRGRRLRPHRPPAGHGDRLFLQAAGCVWVAVRGSLS